MKPSLSFRALSLSLVCAISFAPVLQAQAEEGSSLTSTLKSINSGLGLVGEFTGAVGASQQQMQQMVNQIAALQAQQGLINQNMGQMDQVKAKLAVALGEAQTCMQKAQKDVGRFKKNKIAPGAITTTEPTCQNYGHIIDSAKANILKMNEANTKLACLRSFQNKVNEAAESAKAPFSALTQAAQESWNIRDQIITLHKGIAEKLANDLEASDGYKAKLDKLKKLSIELNNVLNARPGGTAENGLPTGLARKAEDLRRARVQGANQWLQALLSDTQQCFYTNRSMGCDSSGTPASPYECISRQLNPSARNNPGQAARNKFNQGELGEVFNMSFFKLNDMNTKAGVDVKDVNGFLNFAENRFNAMASEQAKLLSSRKFAGSVNSSQLASYMRDKMNACFSNAVGRFKSGIASEGNPYKDILNNIEDQEKDLANDTKVWIETVSKQMNEFRTAFQKVYNSDLPQFTANCTVNDDPYVSVDCMRVLSVSLKAGIEGTTQSIKLSNGTYYTANEGITSLNVQALSTDQSGRPTLQNQQVQCRGFNECLTFLEQSKTHHEDQVQSQTVEREKFVQDHNKNVDLAIGAIAAQFGMIGDLMTRSIAEVNQDLTKASVNASVKSKQVDGETLSQNETTKIYEMPKNMKSALAAKGSYTEIEDTAEVTQSLNDRLRELNKKVNEAFRKKSQCNVKKSDYEALASYLPRDCDDGAAVLRADRTVQMMPTLEALLRKTGVNPKPDDRDDISQRYRSCMAGLRNTSSVGENDGEVREDIRRLERRIQLSSDADEKKTLNQQIARKEAELDGIRSANRSAVDEERKMCSEQALGALDAISKEARNESYTDNNSKVLTALRRLSEARAANDKDEASLACADLKAAARSASIPADEGETPENASSGSGVTNPIPRSGSAQ